MQIYRAYKTEVELTEEQCKLAERHAGAARFVWNWALAKKKEAIDSKSKVPNYAALSKQLIKLKSTELSWLYEISSTTPTCTLISLDRAFKDFFRRCKLKSGPVGFPKFKAKKKHFPHFILRNNIYVGDNWIIVPKLGKVALKEFGYLPIDGVKILSVAFSKRAGKLAT